MGATRSRPPHWHAFAAAAAFLTVFHLSASTPVSAQGEVTDAELARASSGRTLKIGSPGSDRVTDLPLEVYVARVLSGEGEPRAADAAQQALAIAIRTYALFNEGRHRRDGYDLCDTTHCQVLRASTASARRAALATAGQVLLYQGRPAELFYSASCGGRSEAASAVWPGMNYPYLTSIADDVHADDEPWNVDMSLGQIHEALERNGFSGRRLSSVDVESWSTSGRVSSLRVTGMTPDLITGEEFRRAIGPNRLKSTAFTISRTESGVRFVGRGFGHGVGLCVIGAGRRAQRGESAPAILARYYPGLELTPVSAAARRVPGSEPRGVPSTASATGPLPRGATAVPSPAAAPAASPAPAIVPRRSTNVIVTGAAAGRGDGEVERMASDAHAELSRTLGVSLAPITIELHDTIEAFRQETGQPWWVSAVVSGTTVDLAPLPLLEQRDGVSTALRIAIAELLTRGPLTGKPAWVRIGAARYFGRGGTTAPSNAKCPSDADLTLATSATAQRDAESRAEACFAKAYRSVGDWRSVR